MLSTGNTRVTNPHSCFTSHHSSLISHHSRRIDHHKCCQQVTHTHVCHNVSLVTIHVAQVTIQVSLGVDGPPPPPPPPPPCVQVCMCICLHVIHRSNRGGKIYHLLCTKKCAHTQHTRSRDGNAHSSLQVQLCRRRAVCSSVRSPQRKPLRASLYSSSASAFVSSSYLQHDSRCCQIVLTIRVHD